QETAEHLAELMIGARVTAATRPAAIARQEMTRLEVSNLNLRSDQKFGVDLKEIAFKVGAGEILGIAGIAGNGQSELMAALPGEARGPAGAVRLNGRDAGQLGPAQRRRLKAAFVPEERNGHGAVGPMTLDENAFLSGHRSRDLDRMGLIK